MRFADLFAAIDLSVYPAVGLIAFFAVFVGVGVKVMRTSKGTMLANARLPLDDSSVAAAAPARGFARREEETSR